MYLGMTPGEDRPFPQALVVRHTGGQAVKRAGASRLSSFWGACCPPNTLGGPYHPPCWDARRARERRRDTHIIIYRTSGDHTLGGGKAGSRRPLSLSLFLVYPTPTPWHIKGKGRTLIRGTDFWTTFTHSHSTSPPETWEPVPSLVRL
jgi:hypothetical protein